MQVVFTGRRKTGRWEMEATEKAVRDAMHHAGAALLSRLLSTPPAHTPTVPCACGGQARYHDTRSKSLLTVLGPVAIERPYYVCPHCQEGQSPLDRELDVVGTGCSPGVRRMMAVVGSDSSFDQGREQLELLAGLQVTTKAVERQAEAIGAAVEQQEQAKIRGTLQLEFPEILGSAVPILYIEMDGVQVPVVRSELQGRAGRVEGQDPRTREVKLGCVFTQTTIDKEGRPLRDEGSTTYTGAIETTGEFGPRIYTEAWERGWSRAQQKVVLGDGADWIWNLADQHFPSAIQIVDLYHAREHIWELAAKLFPAQTRQRKHWAKKMVVKLNRGRIQSLVRALRSLPPPTPELGQELRSEANYFESNKERMRYPAFKRQHLFVGSGVIEAGCKTVVGSRLKQSGMFWTVRGANSILALRCSRLSGKFEDHGASRARAA